MAPAELAPPTLADVEAARSRVAELALRTPLLPLRVDDAPADIRLKLENLQPIGSFKLRGAGNALKAADPARLAGGVSTASAGNMAQGLAWCARELGVPCRVVVPDHAPRAKLDAIERLGGETLAVPFAEWWEVIETHRHPGLEGHFVHPVCDPHVIAGNGTIGLELLEDLPDVEAVLVPYGGGALSCGIAAAVKARRPDVRVYACEVATAAPLAAAFAAGEPVAVDYKPSFVDGIGGRGVLAPMWPLARDLLDGSLVVSLEETAAALRLLVERNHVVAEGAGAAPVAAALAGKAGTGRVACVVSGGNLDPDVLAALLRHELP